MFRLARRFVGATLGPGLPRLGGGLRASPARSFVRRSSRPTNVTFPLLVRATPLLSRTAFVPSWSSRPAALFPHRCGLSSTQDSERGFRCKFEVPEPRPRFNWEPPPPGFNPAGESFTAIQLLLNDHFIDKSAALHDLLKDRFRTDDTDFRSIPLALIYPRRFAKTALLQFIEAAFCPLPSLDRKDMNAVKLKIAALERGPELLAFGLHPVVSLTMLHVASVDGLNRVIDRALVRAGLLTPIANPSNDPAERLIDGVTALNSQFKAETGKETQTIVLIDEYDKSFRDNRRAMDDPLLRALRLLYGLGKEPHLGISLLVLCGLTRMVGSGLAQMNNLVDVSHRTKHHGLCGIAAGELVSAADGKLDERASELYDGQNFREVMYGKEVTEGGETVLYSRVRESWNGFRFGVDYDPTAPDPTSPGCSLYSPMDVWKLVCGLLSGKDEPSSEWLATMKSEFEFVSFAEKYTSADPVEQKLRFHALANNLNGGSVSADDLKETMTRDRYLSLADDLDVKKVLFELGLLAVKEINGDKVLLGSPNRFVTKRAMELLVDAVGYGGVTSKKEADEYLSEAGLALIVSDAARKLTEMYEDAGLKVVREYALQDRIFLELLLCFPRSRRDTSRPYDVRVEVFTGASQKKWGFVDMVVETRYPGCQKRIVKMEVKLEKIEKIEKIDQGMIDGKHEANLADTTAQLGTYVWKGDERAQQEDFAVSGVWHPSGGDRFAMHTSVRKLVESA